MRSVAERFEEAVFAKHYGLTDGLCEGLTPSQLRFRLIARDAARFKDYPHSLLVVRKAFYAGFICALETVDDAAEEMELNERVADLIEGMENEAKDHFEKL
jgi:hypothetical protein